MLLFMVLLATPPQAWTHADGAGEIQLLQAKALLLYGKFHYRDGITAAKRALDLSEQRHGPHHATVAASLRILGHLHSANGSCRQGLPLHRRAYSIWERTVGPTHPDTIASLGDYGSMLLCVGRHTEADVKLRRALALREASLGPSHPDTAASLFALGLVKLRIADYAAAISLQKRALGVRETVLGAQHPDTARSLSYLGLTYTVTGNYAAAESLLARATSELEGSLGASHPETGRALAHSGLLHMLGGSYVKAQAELQRGLSILEESLGSHHPDTGRAMSYLGMTYCSKGDNVNAIPLLERAANLLEKELGSRHADFGRNLNFLVWARFFFEGTFEGLEAIQQRALLIIENAVGPMHPDTADALANLAVVQAFTGAYEKAEPLLLRALSIQQSAFGDAHPSIVRTLTYQSYLRFFSGDYSRGLTSAQRAAAMGQRLHGLEHPATASALNILAIFYAVNGDFSNAESTAVRVLEIRRKRLGLQHIETIGTLNDLASIYQLTGAYASAMKLHQRALDGRVAAIGEESMQAAQSMQHLATVHWQQGDHAAALPLFQRAQAINGKIYQRFLLTSSESTKVAFLRHYSDRIHKDVSFSLAAGIPEARTLGLNSVLQYKGQAVDAFIDSIAPARRRESPQDRAIFDQLARAANQLSALTYGSPEGLPISNWRGRIEALAKRYDQLELELAERNVEFRGRLKPTIVQDIARVLPAQTTLIEWFLYRPFNTGAKLPKEQWAEPRYVAYVVRRSGRVAAIDVGNARDVDTLIRDFKSAAEDPGRADAAERSAALYHKIIAPLLPHLGGVKHLLLSPDGALNHVPIGALLGADQTYLADHFDITYLATGRDLLRINQPSTAHGRFVVVADPDFGRTGTTLPAPTVTAKRSTELDRGGLTFHRLPYTSREAHALRDLFDVDQSNLLLRQQATEEHIKRIRRPGILHIATHGFFLSDQDINELGGAPPSEYARTFREHPLLRSGLALSGANTRRGGGAEDGILTALEVAQLDLRDTQLVVLSACETGVGEVQNGNGIYGLRRALALAGARTQVSSLWQVPDASTKDLMIRYYTRLREGQGRSAALRAAQASVRNTRGRSHPYYWAAFVSVGDWASLPRANSFGE